MGSGDPSVYCHPAASSGQQGSCSSLPHYSGQWAAGLLLYTAPLPWGCGHWNSFCALPHCLFAVGSGTPSVHCCTALGQWPVEFLLCTAALPGGSGQWNSSCTMPHCLLVVGSGTPSAHCLSARGQWTVELFLCTAELPWGVGSGTPSVHCLTAWGQLAVELLRCITWALELRLSTAPLLGSSGQWNSFCAPPHCMGAVGSETVALYSLIALG